ncbi:NEW3 domain-containing protein [Micromonospora yasonensis]|uniref:NEW3 domain-containing protein n=1 Tax=Micromonospora yasonensis TaxID=1128667 RepID=UPI00222F8ACF|nr:NEW3 domain-containing protein [Micromonospora yasonensis]MCW3839580.1 NEW3 domain-containing protein [Micromonospora yasonensis]
MQPQRRWCSVVAAGALALASLVSVPAAATAAAGAMSPESTKAAIEIPAGYLSVGLDSAGTVVGLRDTRTGFDYLEPDRSASLVSLVIDGKQQRPTEVTRAKRDPSLLTFANDAVGFKVEVRMSDQTSYTTFDVVSVEGPDGADVQTLLWGPLPTSITKTIGEVVGVVHDDAFAVGLRPLNDRTEGTWPQEYQQYGWESEVHNNPSRLEVWPHEEYSAAGKTPWGSVLRAFTYDYTKERVRQNVDGYPIPVGPLPGIEGEIVGSKIALFGTSPELTPTVLSAIAAGEGLPYPTQDGQWQKAAQASSQSFLVLGDLRTENIPTAARFAKAAGIEYLYSLPNAVGPWQTTGHYQFNSSLGGSDAGAAAAVELAKANGVHLGVHTISDFISTNDAYVTPPADRRLALGGRATLTRPVAATDTALYVDDGGLFTKGVQGRLLRIGDEFVSYATAQQVGDEWKVSGLGRGQWRSVATDHAAGDQTARVIINQYGGAIGGLPIIDEIADRLATAWNATGILSNSYDGLESASLSGWGNFGQARLVNGAYAKNEAKDGFVTETSRMTSNTWDAITRASWGEVASTSMSQVFINNEFYRANFLPGMLGWISLGGSESLLSVESKLARGAGLNAGAGFQTSVGSLTRGGTNTDKVLDAIKQWETARNLGAFSDEQKERFRDQSTYWHLTVAEPGVKWSLQELNATGQPVGDAQEVVVPTPKLSADPLPPATLHQLYETRLTTNTPATVRYEVTAGALPEGLELNKDTGGITGTPVLAKPSRFTVTAYSTDGLPEARAEYEIDVRPAPVTSVHLDLRGADGPALPGVRVELETRLSNAGKTPIRDLELRLDVPAGWDVEATSPTVFDLVPAGTHIAATWTVTPPTDAAPGDHGVTAVANYLAPPGPATEEATSEITVMAVHQTLESAFNNIGITSDDNPKPGNYDGGGNSFSAQALAQVGLTPGAKITHDGIEYAWTAAARGSADNVAGGAPTIQLSGQFQRIGLLASGIGQAVGTVTVHYDDGTSAEAGVEFPNWCCSSDPINGGASLVATANYRNTQAGPANFGAGYRVFAYSFKVDSSKRVVAVTLPKEGTVHVFAIGAAV